MTFTCLLTCLYSRAFHVETCLSLSTDSFILALRRFIAIRGPVVHIRCDRGTNFVGASNELKSEMEKIDCEQLRRFLHDKNAVVEFKFNPLCRLILVACSNARSDPFVEFLKKFLWSLVIC